VETEATDPGVVKTEHGFFLVETTEFL